MSVDQELEADDEAYKKNLRADIAHYARECEDSPLKMKRYTALVEAVDEIVEAVEGSMYFDDRGEFQYGKTGFTTKNLSNIQYGKIKQDKTTLYGKALRGLDNINFVNATESSEDNTSGNRWEFGKKTQDELNTLTKIFSEEEMQDYENFF